MSQKCTVVVIGAGPSGLYAASQLVKQAQENQLNLEVIVVEATERIGGRVYSVHLKDRFPDSTTHVEFGPEFVHGECENLLIDLVNKRHPDGSGLLELEYPNYFYFGKEGKFLSAEQAFKENPELEEVFDVYEEVEELDAETVEEKSLLQYFTEKNVSSRFLDVADAIFANDYGSDLSQIGLKETIIEQQKWNYGEKYLVLTKNTFSEIIQDLAEGLNIKNSWAVSQIDYQNAHKIIVKNSQGEQIIANKVIISVPISILQREDIHFTPRLNNEKIRSINSVKLTNAIKVFVIVNKKFWPNDFYDAVCSDSFVPEIWLTPAATAINEDLKNYTIIGFITGDRANRVCSLPEEEVKRLFLLQLDSIFGSTRNLHPATNSCVGFFIRDWSKEPFFYGSYTYPTIGAHHLRENIGKPVSNCLFFCGEATHTGINPCVHGAFETASRAVSEVIHSLSMSKL